MDRFIPAPLWRVILYSQVARDPSLSTWPMWTGWPWVFVRLPLLERLKVWWEIRKASREKR